MRPTAPFYRQRQHLRLAVLLPRFCVWSQHTHRSATFCLKARGEIKTLHARHRRLNPAFHHGHPNRQRVWGFRNEVSGDVRTGNIVLARSVITSAPVWRPGIPVQKRRNWTRAYWRNRRHSLSALHPGRAAGGGFSGRTPLGAKFWLGYVSRAWLGGL